MKPNCSFLCIFQPKTLTKGEMNLEELDSKKLAVIWEHCTANPDLKEKVEQELILRKGNRKFSKEYLFSINRVGNKALTIHFIPTTPGYLKFGKSITVDLILEENEVEQLHKTYSSQPPIRTYGLVKSKSLIYGSLSAEQDKELKQTGYDCSDIGMVEYESEL